LKHVRITRPVPIGLDLDKAEGNGAAEQLYFDLTAVGVEVLSTTGLKRQAEVHGMLDLLACPLRAP